MLAVDLYSSGKCSAKSGDFVALMVSGSFPSNDKDYLIVLAETMAGQGAKALVYEYNYSVGGFRGTLYAKTGDTIKSRRITGDTAEHLSEELSRYADRTLDNLTVFAKYRRWINVLCLVMIGFLMAFLAFSVVMMQIT